MRNRLSQWVTALSTGFWFVPMLMLALSCGLALLLGFVPAGGERMPAQDIRFQSQQLTDVVLRALLLGINDPFTAVNGIDEIANRITLLAERVRVSAKPQDRNGALLRVLEAVGTKWN